MGVRVCSLSLGMSSPAVLSRGKCLDRMTKCLQDISAPDYYSFQFYVEPASYMHGAGEPGDKKECKHETH